MLRHDLTSLRLFTALCETQSLSRAAERMNMALSAASRRLHQIEDEVSAPLVRRLPHGMEPTVAGLTLLRYARAVLSLSDQLIADIGDYQAGVSGRVRVFASSSALVECLARDLAAFSRQYPDVRIDLEERPTAETIQALKRRIADIGVIVRGQPIGDLISRPYARDRLAVAVHRDHPLAERETLKLAELLDEDFVALDAGSAVYRLLDDQVRALGRVIKLRVQVRSFEVMCQMAAHIARHRHPARVGLASAGILAGHPPDPSRRAMGHAPSGSRAGRGHRGQPGVGLPAGNPEQPADQPDLISNSAKSSCAEFQFLNM